MPAISEKQATVFRLAKAVRLGQVSLVSLPKHLREMVRKISSERSLSDKKISEFTRTK